MRIGLLTLPLNTNYGGILQTYALQTVLERMDNEVCVISFHYLLKEPSFKTYINRYIKKYILKRSISIYGEKRYNDKYRMIHKHTQVFINKYIKQILYHNLEEINDCDFDALVVGSDQVWRYDFGNCFYGIANAYLQFAKDWNIKRVSYSASFGLSDWTYSLEDQHVCSDLLKAFDAVSVREIDAVRLCKKYLGCEAKLVLDPTMLLTKRDYQKLISDSESHTSYGNLFYYILDANIDISPLLNKIQSYFIPFTVNSRCGDESAPMIERIHPPVEQWLRAFDSADMVVTDSFHGCVFSIIFNKPFAVYLNHKGGTSRIFSLLSLFGLENRIIDEDFHCLSREIDWTMVDNKMEKLRQMSITFLKESLSS